MKIFTSLDECSNQMILKASRTSDGEYLGIKTAQGVLFLKANISVTPENPNVHYRPDFGTMTIIESFQEVPQELLELLNLKIDLVSTDTPQTFIRG